jgi:23S rRNA (cytosine1962-C5)-methyltransferase
MRGDAFALLAEMGRYFDGRQFDLVVIDPPALAKSQAEIGRALAAYQRLVRLGLAVLAPDGVFVMASCSSRITADQFFDLVHETARAAGRPLTELARAGHAADHPVNFPEGAYLKCLFSRLVG